MKRKEKGGGWGLYIYIYFLTYCNFLPDLGWSVMGIEPVQLIEMHGKN